ncbi:dol-P-Glc:Glc(2)Man(9)GlcNAc(2)-PP-Dol alpha-1,2-glucosyltransferase isoform X2 [Magnolia sinica]|uniref:dol-P-Glc:Glc(2)Man(9)GlcNAc(2)-PP-Dol alpha-1,2-glucosyltransferase isoform X2 n=1 Tax=Magnolia sinica TaxID=86752 RepID=UPI002659FE42|nr:dol-P-Glc:Glc(2)Man(9)GlcNAc(2)-PP-Dol alpha-1,2-glucosyltransferase isoform X2 [Magnolia sinica]
MGRIAVVAIAALWVIPISILVNRVVPEPYMDEIFHIPQAQQYCRGDFKGWDPMITTPPGLYYLSLAYLASLFPGIQCIKAVSSFSDLCSAAVLRSTNGVLAAICGVIIYDILMHLRPALGERRATVYTVVLTMFPLHWFFTFLYYTDVASLTAVLAMYLACLKRRYWFSALLGGLGIFIRQTNVVWMLFVACIGAINYISVLDRKDDVQSDGHVTSIGETDGLFEAKRVLVASNLRKRKMANYVNKADHSAIETVACSSTHSSGLLDEFQDILLRSWCLKWEILVSFLPFIMVLAAFVTFVFWNGSVVLGAKEAHAVSPHFAQIMYFALVSAAAMAPAHFSLGQAAVLCRPFGKNRLLSSIQWFMALTAGLISVHFFSIAHPYLLADNRHYTFYIWRKVINAHCSVKYLLVPLYVYSWFSIFNVLGKTQKKIWVLLFSLACAAVLIPTPLVEFRYYTIPFYFMILHSRIDDYRSWFLIGTLYIAVNILTMMMFLFRPFHWSHEPGTQRFIW